VNGTAIRPLYVVQSGSSFVFSASTLEMTEDPRDAIAVPLSDAITLINRLRVRGFEAAAIADSHAMRRYLLKRWAIAVLVLTVAVAAAASVWRSFIHL
jgi:hypothetical protein